MGYLVGVWLPQLFGILYALCSRFGSAIEVPASDGSGLQKRHRMLYSRHHRRISDQWIQIHLEPENKLVRKPCPCKDGSLCRQIEGSPIRRNGELFGFVNSIKDSSFFNWTHVSTVAWASEDVIMCQAHAHQSRAVLAAPSINLIVLQDVEARREWIQNALVMVQSRYRDGIVFDYERPIDAGSPLATVYSHLVQETTLAFHVANPSLQVTVCVAWSPDGIDGRNYLYKELADAADALYVMDYDTQSQIINGACLASANAPYFGMVYGIQRYLSLGIVPAKLILGVPWYGYRYPCTNDEQDVNARYCSIKPVPFRGINCSDAAGSEIPVLTIHRLGEQDGNSLTRRDDYMDASYMNLMEDGSLIQYWFDDVTSLRNKFKYAQTVGLAGVGPYSFDDLNPMLDPQSVGLDFSAEIWRSFDAFFNRQGSQQNVEIVPSLL